MLVTFEGCEDRITNVRRNWTSCVSSARFHIVHTGDLIGTKQVEDWQRVAQEGGAVCYISGYPDGVSAQINSALLANNQTAHERWHVFQTPVPNGEVDESLRIRIEDFLVTVCQLEPYAPIPWDKVYPIKFDENLLAAYIWNFARSKDERLGSVPAELNPHWEEAVTAFDYLFRAISGRKEPPEIPWSDAYDGSGSANLKVAKTIRALLEKAIQTPKRTLTPEV